MKKCLFAMETANRQKQGEIPNGITGGMVESIPQKIGIEVLRNCDV